MLKKSEIAALADKLKWEVDITNKCLDNLFSDDAEVIDGNIVKDETVCDFLRICIKSKFYPIREQSVYNFFRNTFSGDIVETVLYFYNDFFFGLTIEYLRVLESLTINTKLNPKIEYSTMNSFYDAMTSSLLISSEAERSIDFPIDVLIYNHARQTNNNEYDLTLEIVNKLTPRIGFKVFRSQYVTENLLYFTGVSRGLQLEQVVSSLKSYYTSIKKHQRYYSYCLCERLWLAGYGRRLSFKLAAEIQGKPSSSVHRRFYDVLNELKKQGLHYQDLISTEEMRHIDRTIERIERFPDMYKNVNK